MSEFININSNAVVSYTNKLEQIHRSALPSAVRNALNTTAFNVKTDTMPKSASKAFTERKKNFFKANSKVTKASGFEIKDMKSIIGFVPLSGTNKAVDELQQQEDGGTIGSRSFIPTKEARVGGSMDRQVRVNLRMSAIKSKRIINAEKGKGSAKQRFVRAAIKAKQLHGKDAFVLGNKWGGGKQTLSRIDRVAINRKDKTVSFKRTPIYTYMPNRKVKVARTNFMKRASMESGLSLERNFQNAAIFQLKKFAKK